MISSCLEIIGVSYGTITLLLRDKVLCIVASFDLKKVAIRHHSEDLVPKPGGYWLF